MDVEYPRALDRIRVHQGRSCSHVTLHLRWRDVLGSRQADESQDRRAWVVARGARRREDRLELVAGRTHRIRRQQIPEPATLHQRERDEVRLRVEVPFRERGNLLRVKAREEVQAQQ